MLQEAILDEYEARGIDADLNTRQLRNDIQFMKSKEGWNIELEEGLWEGKKGIYRYAQKGYTIDSRPLHPVEKDYLKMALFVLDRFKTQKGKEWVNETIPRIEQEIILSARKKRSIEYYKNPFLKGLDLMEGLLNAIIDKTPLEIDYLPFNGEAKHWKISPYLLKEYNNRWYLVGHNSEKDSPLMLALDRMQGFERMPRKHYTSNPYDLVDYFEDMIGVTRTTKSKLVKIRLQFTAHRAGYVITKPLHGSQKTERKEDGSLLVNIELIPNKEMYSQLLFFGQDVKVLSPKKIVRKLHGILHSAASQYSL